MLKNFSDLVDSLTKLIGGGISTLLMGVAFIAFLASVINFVLKRRSGDDHGLEQAKSMLGWSVIGLFVMVSVWGLVAFIQGAFGVGNAPEIKRPQTNFGNSTTGQTTNSPSNPTSPKIPSDPCLANPGSIDCR